MTELGDSLERMNFLQLLLLFAFVISYMLALGGLLGVRARCRLAGLALVLAFVFSGLTDPWVHGALLMTFVVAGLGLFVVLTWLLGWLLGPRALPAAAVAEPQAAVAPLPAPRAVDAAPQQVELPPRAGAVR